MAFTSPLLPTDCPSCRSLCLGATILPCGHLVCRPCLRETLEVKGQSAECCVCQSHIPTGQGQTVGELIEQLARDLVLEEMVLQRLAGQGDLTCHICPNKAAITVCVDCGEMYCSSCAVLHRKQKVSKDHAQQELPQAQYNTSGSARSLPPSSQQDVITSDIISSQDSIRYEHDPLPRQQTDKERLRQEGRLFREAASRLKDAASTVRDNVARLQQLESRLEAQHDLLTAYLPHLETPGDVMLGQADAIMPRLKVLLQDCSPPPDVALKTLTTHVSTLLDSDTLSGDVTTHVNTLPDSGTTAGGAHTDPMTAVPARTFTLTPDADGDTHTQGPYINSIVATDDGRLVMADYRNKMVKVGQLTDPAQRLLAVKLETTPLRLALLPDGQMAVMAWKKRMYFVDVTGTPTVVSHVKTVRQYYGLGSVTEDNTLVAGCRKDSIKPATVDILSRAGVVLRSVTDSNTLTALSWPGYLHVRNRTVWVSDWDASAVFRVELDTGRVVSTYKHPDLKNPGQVAVDRAGHCYIASVNGSRSVLVVSPGGQCRRLLTKSDHVNGDPQRGGPRALCVTDWGLVVTWDGFAGEDADPGSIVVGFKLT